ncbi:MAG: Wzz/FepE/Etk N-terminal domain-containing protein [Anaerolineae bacterium]|nr:Wzz/FepE/Etk N-terminal domain-containing protein [Anaerolineae bacterium]
MKIQDYIDVLRRRGWIIILAVVITAVSAFVFSKLRTPVYRASMEVSIQLARPDLGLTQSAKQLLSSYANVMWSEKQADEVIRTLGLYMDPRDLKGDVKIVADDSIMIIKIDVDNSDGELANQIANTWAQLLVQWRDEQNARQDKQDRVFAEIIDSASYSLLRPKTSVNVAAGGVLGIVLGTLVVFAVEWLEAGIIHDPATLEAKTGLTIIGMIPPVQKKSSERWIHRISHMRTPKE